MFIETTRPDVKETVLVPSREWDEACKPITDAIRERGYVDVVRTTLGRNPQTQWVSLAGDADGSIVLDDVEAPYCGEVALNVPQAPMPVVAVKMGDGPVEWRQEGDEIMPHQGKTTYPIDIIAILP